MQTARLENWSVVGSSDPYLAPELRVSMLHGEVHDHPMFDDGKEITTSGITGSEVGQVTTKNTTYKLGEPEPAYLELYPDALERLLKCVS